MYRQNPDQISFADFYLPFGGKLDPKNRWIKLSKIIPWQQFESEYSKNFSQNGQGAPAKSVRVALGSLIIKEVLGASDEETVENICENPYLQYFLGMHEYTSKPPFDPSMFVHFRKRLNLENINNINETIVQNAIKHKLSKNKSHPDDKTDDTPKPDSPDKSSAGDKESDDSNSSKKSADKPANKGKLLIDATCAPADISFPTDIKLLNEGREILESVIDVLHEKRTDKSAKPRTYRKKARKDYLKIAKSRRPSASKRRKGIRQQLGYIKRDLMHIDALLQTSALTNLPKKQYIKLLVVRELYRQQLEMYDQKKHRIDNRIVSISQPHVRPIVRGKAKSPTEFGAKLSASVVNGYTFLDRVSWDAYNESTDLISQVKAYRERFGYYPESVHADQIYRNRSNIKYCKNRNIRMSGPSLGRPRKETETNREELKEQRKLQYQDAVDRIEIEGKFGIAKRRYGLGLVMTKLAGTSESVIAVTILVMNLMKCLRDIILSLFQRTVSGGGVDAVFANRLLPDCQISSPIYRMKH